MRECCAQEGLTLHTFEGWCRQRRAVSSKGQLIAVQPRVLTAEPWAVKVEFPNGVRVRGEREVVHTRSAADSSL